MSPRERPAYDAAVLSSEPDLDELILMLLGETGCRAVVSAPENLLAARILIANLDHAPSAKTIGGLRGAVIVGISRHEESLPEPLIKMPCTVAPADKL